MAGVVVLPGWVAGMWRIDPAHSRVGFSVRYLMTKVRGTFGEFSGQIVTEEDVRQSMVVAVIEMSSVDTGVEMRDNHLRSGDFFGVDENPKMTFTSTHLAQDGDRWVSMGDLIIKEITKAVDLEVSTSGSISPVWRVRPGSVSKPGPPLTARTSVSTGVWSPRAARSWSATVSTSASTSRQSSHRVREISARIRDIGASPSVRTCLENFRVHGVAEHCSFIGGDVFEEVPEGFDVVLIKHFSAMFDKEEVLKIFEEVNKSLDIGGQVNLLVPIYPENIRESDARTVDFYPAFFLGCTMGQGGPQKLSTYQSWLEECGFTVTKVIAQDTADLAPDALSVQAIVSATKIA